METAPVALWNRSSEIRSPREALSFAESQFCSTRTPPDTRRNGHFSKLSSSTQPGSAFLWDALRDPAGSQQWDATRLQARKGRGAHGASWCAAYSPWCPAGARLRAPGKEQFPPSQAGAPEKESETLEWKKIAAAGGPISNPGREKLLRSPFPDW